MAREIPVTVFKFSELSDKAKQRAKDDYAANNGYHLADEAAKSLEKLAEHFGGEVRNYGIDWFGGTPSSAEFDMPDDMEPDEVKRRLDELGSYNPETLKGNGDCKLTGWATDEDAIDGFREAWHEGERDLEALMQAAFEALVENGQADCEAEYTDENFGQFADENDFEYYENGKRHKTK